MMFPISHWQIITTDPDGVARFYQSMFGWEISTANGLGYREVTTRSGQAPDGGIWPAPPGSPEMVQLFVEVDDIDTKLAEITRAGGKVIFPKQVLPDGDCMALAMDPTGRSFGLMTRRPAATPELIETPVDTRSDAGG